jgi:hypothetical protein
MAQHDEHPPSHDQIKYEAERQRRELSPTPIGPKSILNIQNICAGSPVPAGWIKTNDHWDPTQCGDPTSIVYNVWTIVRFDNQPVGTILAVCADAPTPAGWADVGTRWDPTSCGHPTSIVQNIKQIKRLN